MRKQSNNPNSEYIRGLKTKNRIFLAPMHQVNDIAFRLLCKRAGAGLTYTGLINPQTKEKLFFQDKPAVQFACNSSRGIEEFIKKYDKKICLYDLNLGCPSLHAEQSKIGYFMSDNPKLLNNILKTIKENTKKPITIKIRKMPLEKAKQIIKVAEKYCSAIAVHPRSQKQGYSGLADIDFARNIKKTTKLPLIYSGDIDTKEKAEKALKEFDFIMIGRASLGNPSIFKDLTSQKYSKEIKDRVTFMDWFKLAKVIDKNLDFTQVKFQALNFTRGFKGASRLREDISRAKSEEELLKFFSKDNLINKKQ